jgi:hypothetical protein
MTPLLSLLPCVGRRLNDRVSVRKECRRVGRGLIDQWTGVTRDTRARGHGYWSAPGVASTASQRGCFRWL